MKPAVSSIVFFLLLALVSNTKPSLGTEVVLNMAGSRVQEGALYRIESADKRFGGVNGLAVNGSCSPLLVYQSGAGDGEGLTGFALANHPENPDPAYIPYVPLSTDLDIIFPPPIKTRVPDPCTSIRKWKISFDKQEKQYFVVSAEGEGRSGWFRIEKFGSSYFFRFCRSKMVCRNVGIYTTNGLRRLALAKVPLMVRFSGGFVV